MNRRSSSRTGKGIAPWLFTCCALIFGMVVLGGVTRLTHSGLSIAEWQPILGTLPPLSHEAWLEAFHRYQQTPEYRQVNLGMELEAFKGIFWVEYSHRLLGRSIGVVFLGPFLYFLATRQLSRRLLLRLAGIFALGGLQGALGWYMVKSGLVNVPWVSPYRLTAHLAMAFLIYAAILWLGLELLSERSGSTSPLAASGSGWYAASTSALEASGAYVDAEAAAHPSGRDGAHHRLLWFSRIVSGLVFLMVMVGGFVAGNKAGFAFNTFPTMAGQWIPTGMLTLEPAVRNLFENVTTVQFEHRLLALLLAVAIPAFWWSARGSSLAPGLRLAVQLLPIMLAVQIGLGIATLLLFVPVWLAAAHQAGALVLFTISLVISHGLEKRPEVLVRVIRSEAASA